MIADVAPCDVIPKDVEFLDTKIDTISNLQA